LQYPTNGKDHEYNVPHGTVVDTNIVNPVFTEFYMVAHSALKGTGRVPRYTVIHDDADYSLNVLEGITHVLSYEHQVSFDRFRVFTSSISRSLLVLLRFQLQFTLLKAMPNEVAMCSMRSKLLI
jgi:hypothetical protein